jgi:hypothetical protein
MLGRALDVFQHHDLVGAFLGQTGGDCPQVLRFALRAILPLDLGIDSLDLCHQVIFSDPTTRYPLIARTLPAMLVMAAGSDLHLCTLKRCTPQATVSTIKAYFSFTFSLSTLPLFYDLKFYLSLGQRRSQSRQHHLLVRHRLGTWPQLALTMHF